MKFSDVEQLTRPGEYEINVPLSSIERTLNGWEQDYGLELNPDFQRGHVWTEDQQVKYIEFLLRGGITSRVIYFNSPAFGGNHSTTDLDETILCVDGLQRLTACLRFLRNEVKVFGLYFNEFEGSPRLVQGMRFNVNDLSKKSDLLQWYLEFNSGGTIHTKEELDRVRDMLDKELKKAN